MGTGLVPAFHPFPLPLLGQLGQVRSGGLGAAADVPQALLPPRLFTWSQQFTWHQNMKSLWNLCSYFCGQEKQRLGRMQWRGASLNHPPLPPAEEVKAGPCCPNSPCNHRRSGLFLSLWDHLWAQSDLSWSPSHPSRFLTNLGYPPQFLL